MEFRFGVGITHQKQALGESCDKKLWELDPGASAAIAALPSGLFLPMTKNILVTGPPGCGKSTLIEKVVAIIQAPVAGFFTREIREKGKRVGFSVASFDGRKGILAHVGMKSGPRVGKYGVSIGVFEDIAIPSLHAGSPDILVGHRRDRKDGMLLGTLSENDT
jgi:hypothetical protein